MPLSPGEKLRPHQILALIGRGVTVSAGGGSMPRWRRDVTPGGNRFLFSTPAAVGNAPQPPLTVVLNWTALLKN